jgi:hypothetical protein
VKLSRRYQDLPAYAYCRHHLCGWTDCGTSRGVAEAVEAEGDAHVRETRHEVRVVTSSHTILTFPKVPAVTR